MMATEQIGDGETLTVQIPLRLRKRGGRSIKKCNYLWTD